MRIDELRGLRVLIVGCGVTGASVARHLARGRIDFDVADAGVGVGAGGARAALERALAASIAGATPALDAALARARFHDTLEAARRGHDVLVLSPGIPRAHPAVRAALDGGARVIGDIELFAGAVDAPVIAVTGSNGKSTVVAWLAHALGAAGIEARACGNIGVAALDALPADPDGDDAPRAYVLELSSYQLESTTTLAALAATVLNVSDDHLDRYASMDAYAATKRRVHRGARRTIANADDARTWPESGTADAWFSDAAPRDGDADGDGGAVRWYLAADAATGAAANDAAGDGDGADASTVAAGTLMRDATPVLPVSALRPPGRHNARNALAVLALAEVLLEALGADDRATRDALRAGVASWPGLDHRTALVHEADGVRWYDDSKGTNVDACARALEAMPGPVVLIMGGLAKGADFRPLAPLVRARVRLLLLIGRDRGRVADALAGAAPQRECDTLEAAVAVAADVAAPGDVVLLSPACASFDMFRNFEERGRRFAHAARAEAAA